jgi:hypothetical protein
MDGFSPRNVRRLVSKRVRRNLDEISESSRSTQLRESATIPVTNNPHQLLELETSLRSDSESNSSCSKSSGLSLLLGNCTLSNSSCSFQEESTPKLFDLRNDLRKWAIHHNITGLAVNDLLGTLKQHKLLNFLPHDHRTLLNSKINCNKRSIGDGWYCHLGVAKSIRYQIDQGCIRLADISNVTLKLALSFDGLPVSKSTSSQFWPIQGNIEESTFGVFVIGLYHGVTKPSCVKEYLKDLITELIDLKTNGLLFNRTKVIVLTNAIIADAPARSFIKQCKSHNSYNGCEKCVVRGEWSGRVIFPNDNCPVRSDESFLVQEDACHHIGLSPFIELGFPLVSGVPLDYMHLVCLGVVRKLLRSWVKGPIPYKLSNLILQQFSDKLLGYRYSCPKDFCRKPRSLKEVDLWKATEFRTFLLYTGLIAAKGFLTRPKYNHFLSLSIGVRILLSEKAQHPEWNAFSNNLLRDFVSKVPVLYSRDFLSYNMHSLIHLSADAKNHGPLDRISAFPYENNMQIIKRSLRAPFKPLEQAVARISERQQISFPINLVKNKPVECSKGNNCYRLKCGKVVLIKSYDCNQSSFVCRKFLVRTELFSSPCKSSLLGISLVSKLSDELTLSATDIYCKCWLLPYDRVDRFCVIPLHK